MNESSLEARIRSVRKGVRSHQPIDHRIEIVRSYYARRKAAAQKRIQVQLAGPHQK